MVLRDRLLESIRRATNDFSDTDLDQTILNEICEKLVDYVIEVDSTHTQETNAARSLENDLYNKIG